MATLCQVHGTFYAEEEVVLMDDGEVSLEALATREQVSGAMTYLNASKVLVYGMRYGQSVLYLTSGREHFDVDEASKRWEVRSQPTDGARLRVEALGAFVSGCQPPDGRKLFSDVAAYFTRHLDLQSKHTPSLLAAWVMGTYVFKMFAYYPYLAINGPKSSGKSLLEEILSELAFNATSVQTNPTPATIFRDIDTNSCTLILDEIETLRNSDKDANGQLMGVLNVGFKQGNVIKRNEKNASGGYHLRAFDAFSPKVFAGINAVADTVRHRSLEVRMRRKSTDTKVERFNVHVLRESLQDLRDRLHLFALGRASTIAAAYALAQEMELPTGLDDRAKDILEPLFAVASVVGPDEAGKLHKAAEEIAGIRAETHPDDELGEIEAVALRRIFEGRTDAAVVVSTGEVVNALREAGMDATADTAGRLLRKLSGGPSRCHRKGNTFVRGYRVTRPPSNELALESNPIEDTEATDGTDS